ncbi:MAG: hypothetical protein JNJ94_03390 [Chlorobi bacterium]|jgi:hypothetical protein|nr:hypothetical protein [Chlorobiota bacterium]
MDRKPHHLPQKTAKQLAATGGASVAGGGVSGNTPGEKGSVFDHHIESKNLSLLVDDILPSGSLLLFVSADVLNCFINYVDLHAVIVERDPEEDERYISISNRFYTHFHEFGTVIHVVASSATHWWYFCYDLDASDCAIGRIYRHRTTPQELTDWVRNTRLSGRYPAAEIDVRNLHGWRSFQ